MITRLIFCLFITFYLSLLYNQPEKSLITISETSKFITIYELITILLIIGAGLCGISEIAKNKFLGYPGFVVGSVGIIILLLVILEPSTPVVLARSFGI